MNQILAFCLSILCCCWLASCGSNSFSTASNGQMENKEGLSTKLSIVAKLKENAHLPVEEQIALYHQLKKDHFDTYDFANETELTLYGYAFLWENNEKEAIAIFELLIAEFPNSANAYDSMGEAYLQAKDSVKALQFYSKSLQMNPDNFYAEDVIHKLKFPNSKPLSAAEKFAKVYSKEEYQADLDQLGKKLLAVHPHALKFISKECTWRQGGPSMMF